MTFNMLEFNCLLIGVGQKTIGNQQIGLSDHTLKLSHSIVILRNSVNFMIFVTSLNTF